jgi:hypothetical protein
VTLSAYWALPLTVKGSTLIDAPSPGDEIVTTMGSADSTTFTTSS